MKRNKVPTTEELFEQLNPQDGKCPEWVKKFAIEFAKLHSQSQHKELNKNIKKLGKIDEYNSQPLTKSEVLFTIKKTYSLDNII